MATTKRKSRILDEMHETTRGLRGAGLVSKRRMGEFDALRHLGVPDMQPPGQPLDRPVRPIAATFTAFRAAQNMQMRRLRPIISA